MACVIALNDGDSVDLDILLDDLGELMILLLLVNHSATAGKWNTFVSFLS